MGYCTLIYFFKCVWTPGKSLEVKYLREHKVMYRVDDEKSNSIDLFPMVQGPRINGVSL